MDSAAPVSCVATYEAVAEVIESGDTGCPICGRQPEGHKHEEEVMTTESAMEKVDAMAAFLAALNDLGPHMEAVGKLACAAVELQRWGTSLELSVHNLNRDEFDHFDGEETHFPPHENRTRPFWRKIVALYDGDYDVERGVEGRVTLHLYTNDAPVEEDQNEGLDFDPTLYGNGASQEPTQRV